MPKECETCQCPERTSCMCQGQSKTASEIMLESFTTNEELSPKEVAKRNINYVLLVQDLQFSILNLIMVSREIEQKLRQLGEEQNADWFKRSIDEAEEDYYGLKRGH